MMAGSGTPVITATHLDLDVRGDFATEFEKTSLQKVDKNEPR